MADHFTYRKLPSDPCLTQEKMIAYIDGKLSAADQHACEKHMADCAMCEDAMEGLALVKDRSVLTAPVKQEDEPDEKGKVVPLNKPAPKLRLFYAAAAVLVVIFASVYFLDIMSNPDAENSLADNSKADSTTTQFTAPVATEKLDCLADRTVAGSDLNNKPASVMQGPVPEQTRDDFYNLQEIAVTEEEMKNEASEDIVFDVVPAPVLRDVDGPGAKDKSQGAPPETDENRMEGEVNEKEEADKKSNFWDRTKATVTEPAVKRAEQQKLSQDLGTDSRDTDVPNTNVPASPQAVGGAAGTGETQGAESISIAADSVAVAGNTNSTEQSYQSGMNLLNSGQANAAIAMFDKVLQDKTSPRYEDAEFQKANALIKANRKAEAKVLLQSIEAKKGKYAAQATELLKTL